MLSLKSYVFKVPPVLAESVFSSNKNFLEVAPDFRGLAKNSEKHQYLLEGIDSEFFETGLFLVGAGLISLYVQISCTL